MKTDPDIPESLNKLYSHCTLCPRKCGVNRLGGELGECGESARLKVASIGPHYGEEAPISGTCGSGTVFFSGCALKCSFCQNWDLSLQHAGAFTTTRMLVSQLSSLITRYGVHNVNFVTPDHFIPHTIQIARLLRQAGFTTPILYNTSGYMTIPSLHRIEPVADIYMPDFKFADPDLAESLAGARDYPEVALKAIREMVRQKGFLDAKMTSRRPATRGTFVRHLVLPGYVGNSLKALLMLKEEFGGDIPINLMFQYWPARQSPMTSLNRRISRTEYDEVTDFARGLGFSNIDIQPFR